MAKNSLADELAGVNLRRINQCYMFKLPRITQIRKYRDLYNNKTVRQLRVRYNVPIPIFSGIIDTLQAQLDDGIILKIEENDPADWLGAQKANAALQIELQNPNPTAQWNGKFRDARQEMIFTGVGIPKFSAGRTKDGNFSNLSTVAFEDFYFETKPKENAKVLENHLYAGQGNIWLTETDIRNGMVDGTYDREQGKKILDWSGSDYKPSSYWDSYDYANRFQSMNLASESNNYVGEKVFQFHEMIGEYKGRRWYQLVETFTGEWLRFEKWEDLCSNQLYPWHPFHSHPDQKNFASKGVADDLYPLAIAMMDMFNEDMENRKRRNSGARGYDKDMIPNVQELDEAQMGRDRLVRIDTKGGTRKISEAFYKFETPDISGTIDAMKYMEGLVESKLGISPQEMGDAPDPNSTIISQVNHTSSISKRINFTAQPIIESGQGMGLRFVGGLADHLDEPMSIKLYGEAGFEWEYLKRVDLDFRKPPKVTVTSESAMSRSNQLKKANKIQALNDAANRMKVPANPVVNYRMLEEYNFRDVGEFSEAEIALLLDTNSTVDKRTIAETSSAIQDLMMGRTPEINYNAGSYFMSHILEFVKTHQGDPKVKKNMAKFYKYIIAHKQIALDNENMKAAEYIQESKVKLAMSPRADGSPSEADGQPDGAPSPDASAMPQNGGLPAAMPNAQPALPQPQPKPSAQPPTYAPYKIRAKV